MYYLITQGAPLIGSYIRERMLQKGHTVTIIDDFNHDDATAVKDANLTSLHDRAQKAAWLHAYMHTPVSVI